MNPKTRATIGVVITIIIAIIGFSGYSSGTRYMTWFGIKLSSGGFSALLVAFIIFDVIAVMNASKAEEKLAETAVTAQARLSEISPIEIPCRVSITRLSSMLGAAMGVRVLLNGTEVGVLKNGKTLDFTTSFSVNELTVNYIADNTTNSITFTAESGGSVHIKLKYSGAVLTVD